MAKEKGKCEHFWDFMDKWIDSKGITHREFFCKYCLRIRVRTEKKKARKKAKMRAG